MIRKLLLWLLFLLLLGGCQDRIELEQQSYVITIGIDATDQKGIYALTYQFANPEVGYSASSSADEPPSEIVTVNGSDLLSATYFANSIVSKQITLDHTRVIVVSEEVARSDNFLRIIQSASRTPEIRRKVEIIVSKEKASDFITNNKPLMETRPHKYYQSMLSRAIQTGIIPKATIHQFFQITEGDADLFLGIYATTDQSDNKDDEMEEDQYIAGEIPQKGGPPTQFMGAAVFKEGKMIDILDGEETRIAQILNTTLDMDSFITTIPDPLMPEYNITYHYSQTEEPAIDIQYNKDKPTIIDVKVKFKAEIVAIPSLIDYTQKADDRRTLENAIVKRVKKKTEDLIEKSQKVYRSDPFYWSLFIRKHFKDIPSYEEADWQNNIYPNANINVEYEIDKLEFGKMINDTNLNEVRD
ncbi:Ger(x)C family spore germination protein [Gracilibacillus oryzae]|uniref:Ger(X)C family spore germination protein n=1 Tax=Gracilibacillus oryzae TaxID=1672701 RepID=A0A7C8KU65_9BACI|nr:Ger(x)C family spore germination protein [Gracilibacillus oryzae]KAB8136244.1 Ger(x)C family spore germination protein [Gracilibacillus oryzae]